MQRFSTAIKPANVGKILKKKTKKKGASLADTEDDYEYEQHGDSAASGNTADESWADFGQDPAPAKEQGKPTRRASLAGKLVGEWKKKRENGGGRADDDGMDNYENPFADGGFDDMSINYGDDVSVDVTYLEDAGGVQQVVSPMSALRKGQKSKQKTKQVKKQLATMTTLDEGSSDEDDGASSKGAATGDESSSGGDDEYDDFFKYLDNNNQDDSNSKDDKPEEEPVEAEANEQPVKKTKKKKKKKKGDDGASKKKKKKKKVKKKKQDSDDDAAFTTSDLLNMVSPEAPEDRKTVDAADSSPLPAAPSLDEVDLSDIEPEVEEPPKIEEPAKKVDHHEARRALARLNRPQAADNGGLGGLSLDNKMGDSRVDRAARRAIRRSSIGGVMPGDRAPAMDGRSRFDQIVDGKASNRPRFRRKSMDMDLTLSADQSEALKNRVANARPAEQTARPRYRRKSMDVRLSAQESEALRKKIDKSLNLALN